MARKNTKRMPRRRKPPKKPIAMPATGFQWLFSCWPSVLLEDPVELKAVVGGGVVLGGVVTV